MRGVWIAALLALSAPAHAFDANGVELGGHEADLHRAFPNAHCKELEWKSDAADRRCDDARIRYAGVSARITLFLKEGVVQAFDVRFDASELERVVAFIESRHGAPAREKRESIPQRDRAPRIVYRLRWTQGRDHLEITSRPSQRRAQLLASRGNFAAEIYRIK
jgi:hypothetical protein